MNYALFDGRLSKLEQPAPTDLTKFSSVTVLTHGFEPPVLLTAVPSAFVELANSIANAGGGGIVAFYEKESGKWLVANPDAARIELLMRPSKCARITSLKVHFYRQNWRFLSSRYALFDDRLSN